VLDTIYAAWVQDRLNTVATVVLPYYPDAAWFRHYFAKKNRLFRTLFTYPPGSRVYLKCDPQRRRFPTVLGEGSEVAVMVVRLGGL
jgi:hypothetical protein